MAVLGLSLAMILSAAAFAAPASAQQRPRFDRDATTPEEVRILARASPAEVSSLLQTAPASEEEGAGLRALMPEMRSCLAAGSSVSLNRLLGRAILALAAYRLAEHNGWSGTPVAASGARADRG